MPSYPLELQSLPLPKGRKGSDTRSPSHRSPTHRPPSDTVLRENIRTPARSIANLEFHHTTDETNEVARKIVSTLERIGVRAMNGGAAGFPMEADRWGAKIVSHKPVAVAAGLGRMGIHRCKYRKVIRAHRTCD